MKGSERGDGEKKKREEEIKEEQGTMQRKQRNERKHIGRMEEKGRKWMKEKY